MAQFQNVSQVVLSVLVGLSFGCAEGSGAVSGSDGNGNAGAAGGPGSGGSGTGGSATSGGAGNATSSGGSRSTGGLTASGGANASGGTGTGGVGGSEPLPPDPCIANNSCPPGQWINVTPPGAGQLGFGPGPVVLDPATPSDLYVAGGGAGVWKSTDYGNTWTQINTSIGGIAMGYVMAVYPSTPRKVLIAGYRKNFKSTDGGVTFSEIPFDFPDSLYSIQVDPYDPSHLISGLHEVDGIVESTDFGDTWHYVGTSNFPSGGMSWYAFFLDTGSASTTHHTWLAIGQGGGTAVTADGGDSWKVPNGVAGLVHGHGNAQILQQGNTLYLPGTYGPGHGLYRSTDLGASFTRIYDGTMAVAWGTENKLYAMWAWACSGCDFGTNFFITAPLPNASAFTVQAPPAGMRIGANHVAVTSDGNHNIFVGTMWADGIWRYVEP